MKTKKSKYIILSVVFIVIFLLFAFKIQLTSSCCSSYSSGSALKFFDLTLYDWREAQSMDPEEPICMGICYHNEIPLGLALLGLFMSLFMEV